VRRKVNGWGYLDRNHGTAKPAGTRRIGFFGDSFTEARQVPLDSTFFRRIERATNATECIAIGIMGYGTLQSYLECRRWMPRLALDEVVYVFCENDPANLVPALNMSDTCPYPVLVGDSIVVDRSFATKYANKRHWTHRTWQYLKSHTLLFSTLETRWHLLRSRGVRVHVATEDRLMNTKTDQHEKPSYNSPPSALPDSVRSLCENLCAHVILPWKKDVESAGKRFVILYIPRPSEVARPADQRDSWEKWLAAFCRSNDIEMIDPSERFFRDATHGEELFYDHLTSRGHDVLAAAFLDAQQSGAAKK
jgi:hypothetical protein